MKTRAKIVKPTLKGRGLYRLKDFCEKDTLRIYGWKYEGIGWYAPYNSNAPVYRLYNPNAGEHHCTMSAVERDKLTKLGWKYEGIGWYSDDSQTVPMHREYNPNASTGTHNYTSSDGENSYLCSHGWEDEGIGWYAVKAGEQAAPAVKVPTHIVIPGYYSADLYVNHDPSSNGQSIIDAHNSGLITPADLFVTGESSVTYSGYTETERTYASDGGMSYMIEDHAGGDMPGHNLHVIGWLPIGTRAHLTGNGVDRWITLRSRYHMTNRGEIREDGVQWYNIHDGDVCIETCMDSTGWDDYGTYWS